MEHQFERLRPVPVDDLVRLGRAGDGGYVVSRRTIEQTDVLGGLGINDDWTFEEDFLARRSGASLIAVDGSITTRTFRRESLENAYDAFRLALRGRSSAARERLHTSRHYGRLGREFRRFFSQPRRRFVEQMISKSTTDSFGWTDLMRLVDADAPRPARLFVKMDIEGAEHRVIPEMLRHADRISGIAIEFHDCDLLWEHFITLIDRLREQFVIVHTHGNNWGPLIEGTAIPRALEVSFAHRSLVSDAETARPNDRSYPLPTLDAPNREGVPDYPLRFGAPAGRT